MILCNVSGGIDSVYSALLMLQQNDPRDVVLHHMRRRQTRRHALEAKATEKALKWFGANGYKGFEFLESVGARAPDGITSLQDIELVAIPMGAIVRARPAIDRVVISANKEDLAQPPSYARRSAVRFAIMHAIVPDRQIEYLWPIRDLRKRDIIEQMPPELFKLCWYCRNPRPDETPCGKCQPCRRVAGK